MTSDNPDNPTRETVKLRLALSRPHEDYEPIRYPAQSGGICLPHGITEDQGDRFQGIIDERIRPLDDFSDTEQLVGNIRLNCSLAGGLIGAVASMNDTVSTSFQVAVHVFHPTVGVLMGMSGVIGDEGFTLDLRPPGEIDF